MTRNSIKPPRRVLDPMERILEVLFGLIMVLTITSSLSVAEAGRGEVRTMLFAALGCNLAWGIIDGVFYLMTRFSERGHAISTLRALRGASDAGEAQRILTEELPPLVASIMPPADLQIMREKLDQLPNPPARPRLTRDEWIGATAVFLLVVLSTFPVVVPFIFIGEPRLALHISNSVAIVMLFLAGYALGRYAGSHPWRTGIWMVVLGGALVGLAKVLGG